jgi:catechol 2,3-dioxygenase-like lactoylglutathione lyase family enzyme
MASVRYIASDIDKSVKFYRDRLDFSVEKHNPGKFAELTREDLHLFLNAPELEAPARQAVLLNQAGGIGS